MPPFLEDEESSSGEYIPFKADKGSGKAALGKDKDSSDEGGEDEYIIDKIMDHSFDEDSGEVLYNVKWEGWENKRDWTWEPEENLASAPEALEEYWEEIGGKPAPSTKRPAKGNKKRKAADTPKGANSRTKRSKSETPELSTKKKRGGGEAKDGNNDFKLPKGSWEEQVAAIDTIEETLDDKGVMQRFVYVLWSNGSKTRHQLGTVNQKCPQKMLEYYESHLVFRSAGTRNGQAAPL